MHVVVTNDVPPGVAWIRDGWVGLNHLTSGDAVLTGDALNLFPFSVTGTHNNDHEQFLAWVESVLRRCWGGSDVVVRGCVYKAADLPALIAGTQEGLCTFAIESDGMSAELVTINALVPAKGIGTALIGALISRLAANGVRSIRVSTTNDNVNAMGFYQRRGFRIVAVLPGAVDQARKIKPSIPLVGYREIEVHDEVVLALTIPKSQ
jgi:GNAT superfamily N-acetyltransferase